MVMRFRDLTSPNLFERIEDVRKSLAPYKLEPDIFISFTSHPKVGINPTSHHATPTGVYAYPLKEMWDAVVDNNIPYAGNRPYVQVIRSTAQNPLDVFRFTKEDQERVFRTLEAIYPSLGIERMAGGTFEDIVSDARRSARQPSPISWVWNTLRMLADYMADLSPLNPKGADRRGVAFNLLLRKLGYDAVIDRTALGVIHPNEPTQAVFLTPGSYKHVATFHNKRKLTVDKIGIHPYSFGEIASEDKSVGRAMAFYLLNEWVDLLLDGESPHFYLADRRGARPMTEDERATAIDIFLNRGEFSNFLYRLVMKNYTKLFPKVIGDVVRFVKTSKVEIPQIERQRFVVWNPIAFQEKATSHATQVYLSTMLNPETLNVLIGEAEYGWEKLVRSVATSLYTKALAANGHNVEAARQSATKEFDRFRHIFEAKLGADRVNAVLKWVL